MTDGNLTVEEVMETLRAEGVPQNEIQHILLQRFSGEELQKATEQKLYDVIQKSLQEGDGWDLIMKAARDVHFNDDGHLCLDHLTRFADLLLQMGPIVKVIVAGTDTLMVAESVDVLKSHGVKEQKNGGSEE